MPVDPNMMSLDTRLADVFARGYQCHASGADWEGVMRSIARDVAYAVHPESDQDRRAFLDAANMSGLFAHGSYGIGMSDDHVREACEIGRSAAKDLIDRARPDWDGADFDDLVFPGAFATALDAFPQYDADEISTHVHEGISDAWDDAREDDDA